MLTSGGEDQGTRATLAFSAACTALSLDFDTRVFLVGDGGHWAYEESCGGIARPGFPPLAELVDTFLEMGGRIYLCAACDAPGSPAPRQRRHKVQSLSLAPVLSHMVGSTTVTF